MKRRQLSLDDCVANDSTDKRPCVSATSTSRTIYTVGHSARSFDEFVVLLVDARIDVLVDVRSYPRSRTCPQFNQDHLATRLDGTNAAWPRYTHMPALGGYRHATKAALATSRHTAITHRSFASYAMHMSTLEFRDALAHLEALAEHKRVAFFCKECVFWRCHRKMISDALVVAGWSVLHLGVSNAIAPKPHSLWDIARVDANGEIVYDKKSAVSAAILVKQ